MRDDVKETVKWLFNDPNGHFAIATTLLVVAVIGWFVLLFVKPEAVGPAAAAIVVLWILFLTKLKGS